MFFVSSPFYSQRVYARLTNDAWCQDVSQCLEPQTVMYPHIREVHCRVLRTAFRLLLAPPPPLGLHEELDTHHKS